MLDIFEMSVCLLSLSSLCMYVRVKSDQLNLTQIQFLHVYINLVIVEFGSDTQIVRPGLSPRDGTPQQLMTLI